MATIPGPLLITGATGFLGSHLASRLVREGHTVFGTGRNLEEGRKLETQGVQFTAADLSGDEPLGPLMRGARAVIHCAALSSLWGREADFRRSNVIATRRIAEAALENGVERFIHISTPSLYVEPRSREGIREQDPLPAKPINLYVKTKLEAERVLHEVGRRGLRVIVLRPQGIIGIGDRSIMPRILATARKGVFPVIDGGDHWIDITPVESVVEAICCSLRAGDRAIGEAFNITNGEPVRNYRMTQALLNELGVHYREKVLSFQSAWRIGSTLEGIHRALGIAREPLLTRYSACVLGKTRTLSIEKARGLLGYRPACTMDRAIERILPWLRASGY